MVQTGILEKLAYSLWFNLFSECLQMGTAISKAFLRFLRLGVHSHQMHPTRKVSPSRFEPRLSCSQTSEPFSRASGWLFHTLGCREEEIKEMSTVSFGNIVHRRFRLCRLFFFLLSSFFPHSISGIFAWVSGSDLSILV